MTATDHETRRALHLYGKHVAANTPGVDNLDRYAAGVRATAITDGTLERLTAEVAKGATADAAVAAVVASVNPSRPGGPRTVTPSAEDIAAASARWAQRHTATIAALDAAVATPGTADPLGSIATARLALRRHEATA